MLDRRRAVGVLRASGNVDATPVDVVAWLSDVGNSVSGGGKGNLNINFLEYRADGHERTTGTKEMETELHDNGTGSGNGSACTQSGLADHSKFDAGSKGHRAGEED